MHCLKSGNKETVLYAMTCRCTVCNSLWMGLCSHFGCFVNYINKKTEKNKETQVAFREKNEGCLAIYTRT